MPESAVPTMKSYCFDMAPAAHAAGLLIRRIRATHSPTAYDLPCVGVAAPIAA